MKSEALVDELHTVAANRGVTVRYERGDFEGGYCVLRATRMLLINRRLAPARKASLLALGLHEIGVDDLFIKPVVRAFIEDEVAKSTTGVGQS